MISLTTIQKKKVVAYYRHSAEDKQENSVPIQREQAQKLVKQHNMEIIHEEADEGKSGLNADRPAFERLFKDWILNQDAPHFDFVLVYDVSRWGRFQDQDEAAYYEFLCKQHGKRVIYISRGFPKDEQDEQLISHLQTSIERYMAAEYSRQLSQKVFYGSVKVSEQGFSAGGTACYGMARLLLDANKKPIRVLKKGEHKQIANERVTFIPLNDGSTKNVQEIFNLLINAWQNPNEIAEVLNAKDKLLTNGRKWNREKIMRILTNETYAGSRIYNKTWGRLKQKSRPNPRNEWIICRNAFPAIVDIELFKKAQEHLYWLIPSKWKHGIHTIGKVKRSLERDIKNFLIQRSFSENESEDIAQKLPLIFSVTFFVNSVAHWCFFINEQVRQFDTVLGIGISLNRRKPIEKFFAIPTQDFSFVNHITFSEHDEFYSHYAITEDTISEYIVALATTHNK